MRVTNSNLVDGDDPARFDWLRDDGTRRLRLRADGSAAQADRRLPQYANTTILGRELKNEY